MTIYHARGDILHQAKLRLAYKLWEEAGHPWGRDHEFWDAAEAQLSHHVPAFQRPAATAERMTQTPATV
jgi:hypothetical protein